ncbi:hypothetical protein CERSUDRAFT_96609 [Gelatoporia subvermispora B]|uniref:NAD(P)-binding protein n=1 Tax=Ceriporiopsis subvermispora (strain B) TaxID=914234 RepID=M2QEL8_CERS8|nr:hypothetical protein CERSUDRAFT_96609 [Gelatoporia subvermispora B]
MSSTRVWFITGASTGFGRLMTELVLEKGDTVVATLRKPEVLGELSAKYDSTRLLVLELDVKVPEQIATAFAKAQETFGRIDVVFNNAAYVVISEVESAHGHDDLVRDMFETNFWGALHVSQAAIKCFRDVNRPAGGRLLQLSSMLGIEGMPAVAFYVAAKHALEGLSESLARELDPAWNIKVGDTYRARTLPNIRARDITALPGYTTTEAADGRAWMDKIGGTSVDDPRKAVIRFYELASLPEPPLRCAIGKPAIESMNKKAQSLLADAGAYASWSEGLEITE